MNLLLSDDYLLQDYPEHITNTIRSGHATCLRFNRRGDFLASGRHDGTVVIWDLETMGVARKLRGHSRSVSSLSWSRCSRYLLSAGQDWKAILWDLQDGRRYREVRFRAPVYIAELQPENIRQFVVALFEEQPLLVDVTEPGGVQHILPTIPKRRNSDATNVALQEKQAKEDARNATTAIIYSADGKHIIAGTNKGKLNILDARTREIIYTQKVAQKLITTLRLSESGRELVVNAADSVIRTFRLPNLSAADLDPDTMQMPLEHKFQDVVNRLSWNHVAFSATGEYVAASTYNNHELYIWEREHGSLVRMLQGPKEEQGMIEWHPRRALLAACGLETGRINIWSVTSPQKWSALAPDFVEVEENVEYIEREDEFDIHPQEEIRKRRLDAEDEDVDVLMVASTMGGGGGGGVRGGGGYGHDDHVDAFTIPILFNLGESDSEDEFVNVGLGTLRRKSPGDQDDEGPASALGDGVGGTRAVGGASPAVGAMATTTTTMKKKATTRGGRGKKK